MPLYSSANSFTGVEITVICDSFFSQSVTVFLFLVESCKLTSYDLINLLLEKP